MGLDGVELVLAVEETFDIQIDDNDAAKIQTPRMLIDCVLGKVTTVTATSCLTQRAFNLVRRSLLHHGGWKRSEIKPSTSLARLVTKSQRRELLKKVTIDLGMDKPPEFVRPGWVNTLLLCGPVLAGGAAGVATGHVLGSFSVIVFIVVAVATGAIGTRLTRPLRVEFPQNLQTIGDLSRWVMAHKGDLANATPSGWTRDQVAARVREIVVDVLNIKPDFSEDASFVKDLGLG
jgi:acyl carrier protein